MSVMIKSLVCVDTSLVLKLVLPEEHSERALKLWRSWLVNGIHPISPRLLLYEVTSVLRKHAHRGTIPQSSADKAFTAITQIITSQIEIIDPEKIHKKAWHLAKRFSRPTAYDSHYLGPGRAHELPLLDSRRAAFQRGAR